MDVTVCRQQAIDAVSEGCQEWRGIFERCKEKLLALPSAQLEQSIPITWIEKHIEHIKEADNAFATLTAINISTMVKKWREEQYG